MFRSLSLEMCFACSCLKVEQPRYTVTDLRLEHKLTHEQCHHTLLPCTISGNNEFKLVPEVVTNLLKLNRVSFDMLSGLKGSKIVDWFNWFVLIKQLWPLMLKQRPLNMSGWGELSSNSKCDLMRMWSELMQWLISSDCTDKAPHYSVRSSSLTSSIISLTNDYFIFTHSTFN